MEAKNPKYPKSAPREWAAGPATLPRDLFASISSGPKPGMLLTRPLNFRRGKLHVNADIAADGRLTVAVLSRAGEPIKGYDHQNCRPVTGNSIDLPVSWQDRADLSALADATVCLQFQMSRADIFSFWID